VNGTWVFAPKLSYVIPVDETWWVSASILNPDYTQLRSGSLTGVQVRSQNPEDLVAAVTRAVNYTREYGKEQALAEIGNPDGTFAGGGINICAESADGTLLADPTRKEEVGKNLLDATDEYGEKTTLTGISMLRNGTGFVHAMIPGRTGGSERPVPALVYRKKVDDTWWICGSLPGIEIR
jgi:hypothetical protein